MKGASMLKGKRISILGDSISTYKGVSDDGAVCSTIKYNATFYKAPFPLEKTYWKRVIDDLGLTLCVNNSWSGGNLSGREDPDSGVSRAAYLSRDDGTSPDIIIVFMGINDLGRRIDPAVFFADYTEALATIKREHPSASVCCVNLPDRDIFMKKQTEVYNELIARAAKAAGAGFFVADLFNSPLNNDFYYDNTIDGLHPDEDGMKYIAEVIKAAIEENCN